MAIKKEEYICLSAMLRSRETKLLTNEKAQRMTFAPTFEEAAKILVDSDYVDMGKFNAEEIDEALENHFSKIIYELKRLAPDERVVDIFLAKYDYHNAKVLVKGEAVGFNNDNLFSKTGRIPYEKLEYAYKEDEYRDIPKILCEAIKSAKEVLARTSNPQKADFILDKAYFNELTSLAKEIDNDFVKAYTALLIDAANLKSFVRSKKMGKTEEFLKDALTDGGNIPVYRILQAFDGGIETLYANSPLEGAADKAEEVISGGRMTQFELEIDNSINTYLKKTHLITYGPEAVVAYLASAESEITAVRMILSCRLAGVKPENIEGRLRDMYA